MSKPSGGPIWHRNWQATVGELIEALKAFDPALPVFIDAYEGGMLMPCPPRHILAREGGKDPHILVAPDQWRKRELWETPVAMAKSVAWDISKDVRHPEKHGPETVAVHLSRFKE
jgi:hypothetical protein